MLVLVAAIVACKDSGPTLIPAEIVFDFDPGDDPVVSTILEPTVRVTDANDQPVSGATVVFVVNQGGGTITGSPTTTNAEGEATATWLLGEIAGLNVLTAHVNALQVTTSVVTVGGTPTKLFVSRQPNPGPPNRIPFSTQPAVQLQDANGNLSPTAGVVITAAITSGGGTLNGTKTATTSAAGIASFTDLSIAGTVGTRTITFTAPGLASASTTVTTTTGTPTKMIVGFGNNQSAPAGENVPINPSVKITDADDNPAAGIVVNFAVTAGGGTLNNPQAFSNSNGFAQAGTWKLGTTPGTNTVTANSTGLPQVTFTATGTAPFVTQPSSALSGRLRKSPN